MFKKSYLYYGTISLFLHLAILLLLLMKINTPNKVTKGTITYMSTYIAKTTNNEYSKINPIRQPPSKKTLVAKNSRTAAKKNNMRSTTTITHQGQSEIASANDGESISLLLQLLHKQIQSNQQYPKSALLLGQKGTTRVEFRLTPDGRIDALKIISPSGSKSLDTAALAAVSAINPVKEAANYLKTTQQYYIDVIFS